MTDPQTTTAAADLGPAALDVPDAPDEFRDRDTRPRPEDGAQDVTQTPANTPEGVA